MIQKIISVFLLFTFVFIPHKFSVLAEETEYKDDTCESTTSDIILNDYLPVVPAMHKLSFLADTVVSPFAHYNDGSEKMAFSNIYNADLGSLKNSYYKELKNKLNSKYYYADEKYNLLNLANDTYVEQSWVDLLNPIQWWNSGKSFLGKFNISKADKDSVSNLLTYNRFLSYLIKKDENSTIVIFPLTIDRNSGEIKTPEKLRKIEDEIEKTLKKTKSIIESNATIESKLDDLNKFIDDEYKKYENFKEIDASQKTVAFCFYLNRINAYLLNLENGWKGKSLEKRKKIHDIRGKINFLVPNYCFLTERQKSPFSNIDVELDKYNVVEDTKGVKSIYLEKHQIQKYIENLIKSLDSKYTNIKGDYNFDLVKGEKLSKLASEIHATEHQAIINAMENRLEKSEADINRKAVNMFVSAGRAALKASFDIDGILALDPKIELGKKSDTIKFTTEEAIDYLAKNRPELLKDLKNLPVSFSESQTQKDENKETAIQKRSNEQALENYVKINNLGESVLNDIDLLLKDFIDYNLMNAELARNKRTFEAYISKTKDDLSFLDTVKLLIQLSRVNYSSNDLEAIVIEENKKYSTGDASTAKLTEYSIKKIQRMDDK